MTISLNVTRQLSGIVAIAAVSGLFAAGCSSPLKPADNAPFSMVDLKEGTGDPVADGLNLTVNYTGWLYNPTKPDNKGAAFASSGLTPYAFTLGSTTVLEGWNQGITGMKVGGVRRIVLPPSLGYGDSRNGAIPPDATLIFEVELLTAVDPNAPAAQ